MKTCFHKKCGVFKRAKKVTDFLTQLKSPTGGRRLKLLILQEVLPRLGSVFYARNQSDCGIHRDDRRAAVAEKRKRYADDRRYADAHADVYKRLNASAVATPKQMSIPNGLPERTPITQQRMMIMLSRTIMAMQATMPSSSPIEAKTQSVCLAL